MAKPQASDAERFLELFKSNNRSSGRYDPSNGKMFTEYKELTLENIQAHLDGSIGMGAVPIMDDDHCWWGAIDIDNHGEKDDIPIAPIDEKLSLFKIPAIACRSKSGGIHVYAFFSKTRPATKVRAMLARWAALLEVPKAEIFPKQNRLLGEPGKKQLGNWINLPYLAGDATVRYAFRNGNKLSLPQFLDVCEQLRISDAEIAATVLAQHPNAPPCIQRMMIDGIAEGKRNEALFNAVVYFKKAFPQEIENHAGAFNVEAFSKPLGRVEFTRTVSSASRPDYTYRCNEEPIRGLCDRATCIKRQFGITPTESARVEEVSGLPTFSGLIKHLTEPVRWSFEMDGVRVYNVPTEYMLDWSRVRVVIAEQLTKVVPMIKNQEWERILAPLMVSARLEEAPDDSSTAGTIRARLREFGHKVKIANGSPNMEDRSAILRGLPILVTLEDEKQYMAFRGGDFINYLKRTRSEEMKGSNLWFALRPLTVREQRIRVTPGRNGKTINAWVVPWEMIEDITPMRAEIPGSEI